MNKINSIYNKIGNFENVREHRRIAQMPICRAFWSLSLDINIVTFALYIYFIIFYSFLLHDDKKIETHKFKAI